MTLSPEVIEMAKKEVDIAKYYEPSEECTAQHILFKDFIAATKWKGLPKVIFYILLGDTYGQPVHKDHENNLGFKIKLKSDAGKNN